MARKLLIILFIALAISSWVNSIVSLSVALTTCQSWDVTKAIIDILVAGGWTALAIWRVRRK